MKEFEYIDDLIGKSLAGEANAEEQRQLEIWLDERDANRRYFNQMKLLFDKASSAQVQFDHDEAWQKVKAGISRKGKQVPFKSAFNPGYFARIAAAIALLAVASYALYQWTEPRRETFAMRSESKIITDTLPDGSVTVLNRKSQLAYELDKQTNQRKVKLKGEAFFEVKHEEQKPFVIEAADEVLIKDIGTTFNVKAYPNSDTIEVIVESGEVQFYTLKNPGLFLKAGEVGIYNKSLKEFTRLTKSDTNALAYKTKIFSFNNTDLKSALQMLNEVYEAKITFSNPNIGRCRLTVNFKNDSIKDIVEIIAETLGLKAEQKGEEFILSGTGCENP